MTVGDYDNDGFIDLFVTGVGGNRLFHNEPARNGRRFVEVTAASPASAGRAAGRRPPSSDFLKWDNAQSRFPASAAFLDYDGDGLLDLFVCNYVTWSPALDLAQGFQLVAAGPSVRPPTAFSGGAVHPLPQPGRRRFEDVTARAGIHVTDDPGATRSAKSLGVVACDADEDGWPDIVVANDTVRNFFFHNTGRRRRVQGDRPGKRASPLAEGQAARRMGIDWGEYRPGKYGAPDRQLRQRAEHFPAPGRPARRWRVLRRCAGRGARRAEPAAPEVRRLLLRLRPRRPARPARPATATWSRTSPASRPARDLRAAGPACSLEHRQSPDRVFESVTRGHGGHGSVHTRWSAAAARLRRPRRRRRPGRGADGNGGPARCSCERRQDRPSLAAHSFWRGMESVPIGTGFGARVVVETSSGKQQREVIAGRGYLSQSDLGVTFGLGKSAKVERVVVQWPGKKVGEPQKSFRIRM